MHFKKHQDFLYQTKKNKIDFQQQYKNSLDVQKKSWTSRKFVCVCIFFFSLLLTFKTASFFLATRFAYDEKKPKGGQEGIGGWKLYTVTWTVFGGFFPWWKLSITKLSEVWGQPMRIYEKNSFTVPLVGMSLTHWSNCLALNLVECKPTNSKKQTLFLPMGGSFNHPTYQHLPTLWNPAIFTNGIVVIIRSTHKNAIIPPVGLLGLLLVYCQSWILGLVQKMATAIFDTPRLGGFEEHSQLDTIVELPAKSNNTIRMRISCISYTFSIFLSSTWP